MIYLKQIPQIEKSDIDSKEKLKEYGNLTGVSLPTVLGKAMTQKNSMVGKSLLVGITMGFGLDIVEIEKT